MFLRSVTSRAANLIKRSPSVLRNLHVTGVRFSKKKVNTDGPLIIKPGNCADLPTPILEPLCKTAVIVGGSSGFGFAAANHLLCKGAQGVVIIDNDEAQGNIAVKKLCNSYGKARAHFQQCDVRNPNQFEVCLKQALCKHKQIHILFNDLDKKNLPLHHNCKKSKVNSNNADKAIHLGMKIMGRQHNGPDGIIINCASIFGFMGWPTDPFPVYCMKEPAMESTIDLAKKYKFKETGVRLVALCPSNKPFNEMGLPDFPDPLPNKRITDMPPCIPTSSWRIGSALCYVLAWAKTGSTWIVEPECCASEIPRLVHFPAKKGEKVDPKIYESQTCTATLSPKCVKVTKPCTVDTSCPTTEKDSKKKKKR